MRDINLGFVSLIRTTFDVELAQQMTELARQCLLSAGFNLLETGSPVTTLDEASAAASQIAALKPDLLILFQATFADSTMALAFARQVNAPLLLWAVPEPHTGGRLRLNSLCGINLTGHALTRTGIRYHPLYASPDSPIALDTISTWAQAARIRCVLSQTRIGRMGENPAGFETCLADPVELQERFGIELVQFELAEHVFEPARQMPQHHIQATRETLAAQVHGLDSLDASGVDGTLSIYHTLHDLAEQKQLDAFAVRCWPEFFTEMNCAACGAMSMLANEHIPAACEADVNGSITQYMLQELSGEPAFGSDIVSLDEERNALVLWHCGQAPLAMADPEVQPGVTIHSNRKRPLLMEFTLKPGRVTLARLSQATGSYRLVIASGEVITAPPAFSGTSGHVRFNRPAREVMDAILSNGLEHHVSLTYGDYVPVLLALAQMLALPVLML